MRQTLPVPASDKPVPPVIEEVGRRVRGIRLDQGLTLDKLSRDSGVSRRTIISLEAGEANVSLGILDKLAHALGTTFGQLVSEREALPLVAERFGEVSPIWQDEAGSSARLLVSYTSLSGAEMWSWELAPGARYDADPDPPGSEECLLVSAGTLHVEVDGTCYPLASGSYLRLPSDRNYSYVNPAGAATVSFTRLVTNAASRMLRHEP
jgi:transcriptional regulator with XRE-family HTH domain